MSIARPVEGYQGLVEACRARAQELEISRLEIDRLGGLTPGYAGKLLGNGHSKRIWPVGFETLLEVLGMQVLLIENPTTTAKTLARREPVNRAQQRFANNSNSPKQIAAQKPTAATHQNKTPPESHAHLRVVQMKRRGARYG